jgi:hypothetical protein
MATHPTITGHARVDYDEPVEAADRVGWDLAAGVKASPAAAWCTRGGGGSREGCQRE